VPPSSSPPASTSAPSPAVSAGHDDELARAHLLYCEWLRREVRRIDARQQLTTAHDRFASIDVKGFADRARPELIATGEKVGSRSVDTAGSDELTAQERQSALLVCDGLTNPGVAVRLFLSPRTVEGHLRKLRQAWRELATGAAGHHQHLRRCRGRLRPGAGCCRAAGPSAAGRRHDGGRQPRGSVVCPTSMT
jgi:DNA-binding CsgD family transcriptional regulator